jgi:glycosyltransferase involved in cell wall biosynthesis
VGVVGRLSPEKGIEWFLAAAALVARGEPNVGFAVVGDAVLGDVDYARRLARMVRELGLGERTLLTGFAERAADVMRALDLVVVPSDAEPFGRVTIEAMASGKPVVATKTGGSPEIVIDWETGLLVPPRDPAAIAEAVLRLLRQPGMAASMGAEGRRQATERFSIEEHGRTIRRLYEGLLQGGQSGGELAI